MSEQSFIRHIKSLQENNRRHPGLKQGIGDDSAVISTDQVSEWAIATDMILDGTHFDSKKHSPELIGRKALAVNLSDMAAMGARADYALVSLGLPRNLPPNYVEKLWQGLQNLADEFGVAIIGGDTNSWSSALVLNVCIMGQAQKTGCVMRSGARIGDEIYVTGQLGGSLDSNHHLTFTPRVKEAEILLTMLTPTAMTDISDGLATDLNHICDSSGVGAELVKSSIPISSRVNETLTAGARLNHAMFDGEDFELLFTAAAGSKGILDRLPFECIQIGTITSKLGCRLDGIALPAKGFEHIW
jgi:thiamine-monophosphate kinase